MNGTAPTEIYGYFGIAAILFLVGANRPKGRRWGWLLSGGMIFCWAFARGLAFRLGYS
jgi:hypothetical protein